MVVSLSVYYFSSFERQQVFSKRLKSRANNNAQIFLYAKDRSAVFLNRINTSSMELLPKKTVGIYNLDGEIFYEYKTNPGNTTGVSKKVIENAIANGEYFFDTGSREGVAVYYSEKGDGMVVIITAYDQDGWTQLRQLRQIFFISMIIGTLISLVAGHFFSKELLKPVAQMIREVNDISSHNLSHRIRAGETQDELNQLANTFNDLLDRLQEYFNAQRRFISNASHELSTPLTSISSQLEVTLQRERSTDEYRQTLQSVQEDVVQMRQLTKSLLEIAKTGAEGGIELNEIRIDEILFKVMSDVKKINAGYRIELNFSDSDEPESSFRVFGNPDLLYIAVRNIVENGCKYSPDQVSRVHLSFANHSTIIEVKSNGEPIKKEDAEKIFQPFYRSANTSGTPGFGLGLALAQRIIGLHKGTVYLNTIEKPGTSFIISIPNAYSNTGEK